MMDLFDKPERSLMDDPASSERVAQALGLCIEEIAARDYISGLPKADIPPCGKCGGNLDIMHNPRQGRWYAFCDKERRSWGHGSTPEEALEAHRAQCNNPNP